MPQQIQRVARGLATVLSIFGGRAPDQLADENQGVIDLLQFYGLQQVQGRVDTNAALAENGTIVATVPSNQHWLLFAAHAEATKTATMTALQLSLEIGIDSVFCAHASGEFTQFGATVTGAVKVPLVLPYPRLLLPGHQIRTVLDILGTDATANCRQVLQFGVLG